MIVATHFDQAAMVIGAASLPELRGDHAAV